MGYTWTSSDRNIKYWENELKTLHSGYAEIERKYSFIEDNFVYYFLISRTFDFPLEIAEREVEEDWHSLLSDTMKENVKKMKKEEQEE